MGEYRNHDCCEPKECYQPQNSCHDHCGSWGSDNSIWMIVLIVLILCLLCGGDNKGGILGGLF